MKTKTRRDPSDGEQSRSVLTLCLTSEESAFIREAFGKAAGGRARNAILEEAAKKLGRPYPTAQRAANMRGGELAIMAAEEGLTIAQLRKKIIADAVKHRSKLNGKQMPRILA